MLTGRSPIFARVLSFQLQYAAVPVWRSNCCLAKKKRSMSAQLNHTIVWCRDQQKSAGFLAQVLGLPAPRQFMHFLVVDLANGVSLDYYQSEEHVGLQQYAFFVSETEFDAVFSRIRAHATRANQSPLRRARRVFPGSRWPLARNYHPPLRQRNVIAARSLSGHQFNTIAKRVLGKSAANFGDSGIVLSLEARAPQTGEQCFEMLYPQCRMRFFGGPEF